MKKRLSLKSTEQVLWLSVTVYAALLIEDYRVNAPHENIVGNTWSLSLNAALAGLLYLIRMWRERKVDAAG